jgi:hypothetical protein
MTDMTIDDRELGTVLAALRLWRRAMRPADLLDIATGGGEFVPLDIDEIDDLCIRINCGDVFNTTEED